MTPSRPQVVAGLFVALIVLAGVIGYVRIADVHAPRETPELPLDGEPQAIIDAANEQFRHVDHRTVARVYRLRDGERRLSYVFEDAFDYSDRQYLGNYVNYRVPLDVDGEVQSSGRHLLVHYRLFPGIGMGQGDRNALYVTDGRVEQVWGNASEFEVGSPKMADPESLSFPRSPQGGSGAARSLAAVLDAPGQTDLFQGVAYHGNVFLPHDANWRVVAENASTLILGIDDPAQYYRTRRMSGVEAIHDPSRIRVYVDKQAGHVDRIVEHRVITVELNVERDQRNREVLKRLHYVIVTDVRDWGTLDLARPSGVGMPDVPEVVRDFLSY